MLTGPPTAVHLFAGSGGCTLGFQRAGFRSLGSFDFDPAACRDLERLTGGPAFCVDLAAMQPGELLALTKGECPDVVVMSPPCKSFSGCMPAERAREAHYVDMSQLAVRGVFLALEAWAPKRPRLILVENVPRIQSRGAELLAQVVQLLQRSGYTTDQRTHDCGVLGGLAQHRERFLLVARHLETCPDVLRKPPPQRVRTVGEVLLPLPSPAADHGDPMHRLPLLSPLNWLRLAAIRAGKDWRDLPAAIRLGGEAVARHDGKPGVEPWNGAAHTVIGRGSRPGSTWASTADPRVGFGGEQTHSGLFGVEDPAAPAHTVTGNARVQANRGAFADARVGWDPELHGGRPDSFGVGRLDVPSLTVRGRQDVQTSRASVADPRLGSEPRNGVFGVLTDEAPSGAILGHHRHDSAAGSFADARLRHAPRRGTMGVLDPAAPAPTVRARHEPRQAPAAVVDERGWPIPTHELVREGDELVLYGSPLDLTTKRACYLVIRAPDGTWHRPLTDRELAVLQGFPVDCQLEGPSSSSRNGGAGRREHIGNAIPPPTAEAIAREAAATLRSSAQASFLVGGDVWVERADAMEASA